MSSQPKINGKCDKITDFLSRKSFILILTVLILIFAKIWPNIFFIAEIKVLTFNVFGLPLGLGGCREKFARISAIADYLKTANFDIIFLQELWIEGDQEILKSALENADFFVTEYRELCHWACDGYLLPFMCSGLTIASKFPIVNTSFTIFDQRGSIWDGEILAGKGVAIADIKIDKNIKLQLVNTHMIAEASNWWNSANEDIRKVQMEQFNSILKSFDDNFDIRIVGGDFNTNSPDLTLISACDSDLVTYGDFQNTFSNKMPSVHLDHIFYDYNAQKFHVLPKTKRIVSKSCLTENDEKISLSDHEGVSTTFTIDYTFEEYFKK